MENTVKYILLFFFYSAAGWCLESLYCSFGEKKLINRGFLTGPLCPIYGTAAIVLTVLIYNPFKDKPLVVFLLGIVLCDIVEFITSLLMEKLFAARWWDYTYEFMNLDGRICLKHSLYWGIISVVFVNVIHPVVDKTYDKINGEYTVYILIAVLVIFAIDLINAVRKALDIRKLQLKLNGLINMISEEMDSIKGSIEEKYAVIQEKISKQADKVYEVKYQIEDLYSQLEDMLTIKKVSKENSSKNNFARRIFYNNPNLERRTRKQMDKLRSLIDDIKANIYEGEDMQ